jgi:hypothetical protein
MSARLSLRSWLLLTLPEFKHYTASIPLCHTDRFTWLFTKRHAPASQSPLAAIKILHVEGKPYSIATQGWNPIWGHRAVLRFALAR